MQKNEQILNKVLKIKPDFADAHYNLFRHYEERNNLDLIVEKKNTIPYLVDQHLLDKKNA